MSTIIENAVKAVPASLRETMERTCLLAFEEPTGKILAASNAQGVDALTLGAVAARLAAYGTSAACEQNMTDAEAALQAAVVALRSCEAAGGAREIEEGGSEATLSEVAFRLQLGLALALFSQGGVKADRSVAVLSAARGCIHQAVGSAALLRGAWLALCVSQGFKHRQSGRLSSANEALTLAAEDFRSALQGSSALHAQRWALQQLACIQLMMGNIDDGLARANEALVLVASSSSLPGASMAIIVAQRFVFRIICRKTAIEGLGGQYTPPTVVEALTALMKLIWSRLETDPGFVLAEMMGTARELLEYGLGEAALQVLQYLRQKFPASIMEKFSAPPEKVCRFEMLANMCLAEAELLALDRSRCSRDHVVSVFTQIMHAAAQGQQGVANEAARSSLLEEVAPHLWRLAFRAVARNRSDIAVLWLRHVNWQSLPHSAAFAAARVSSALALCLWLVGDSSGARNCANTALRADAGDNCAAAVLLLTCDTSPENPSSEDAGMQKAAIMALPAKALAIVFRTLAAHVARGTEKSESPLITAAACAKVLAIFSQPEREWPQAAQWNAETEDLASSILQLVNILSMPKHEEIILAQGGGFAQCLDALATFASSGQLDAGDAVGVACRQRVVRNTFQFVWNRAIALGQQGRWSCCAHAFDCALAVSQSVGEGGCIEAGSHSQQSVAEEEQMCILAKMAALLEEARSANSSGDQGAANATYERVMLAAEKAREATEKVSLARQQVAAQQQDKALPLLITMEFEARITLKDRGIASILQQAAAAAILPPRCYLTMARQALHAGCREASMQCLDIFLRAATVSLVGLNSGSAADVVSSTALVEKYAMARREQINLHSSRNDSLACFEETVSFLQSSPCAAQAYPARELEWLIAISWSNGAHFGRSSQFMVAQRWIRVAMDLVHFCSSRAGQLPHMKRAHDACFEQLATAGGA